MATSGAKPAKGRSSSVARRLAAAVAAVLAASVALAPWASGEHGEPVRYAYVANQSMWIIGPDLAAGVVAEATGVRTAPLGNAHLAAGRRRLDVTVDDANEGGGRIPLAISQAAPDGSDHSFRVRCIPAGRRTTLRGLEPAHALQLTVIGDAYGQARCGGIGGTTGVLTVHR